MLNLNDGRAPNEATIRVKQLEVVNIFINKYTYINLLVIIFKILYSPNSSFPVG